MRTISEGRVLDEVGRPASGPEASAAAMPSIWVTQVVSW